MRKYLQILFCLSLLTYGNAIFACATCLCGDPTITTMGTEKPFAGRTRFSVEYLTRTETVGDPQTSEHTIKEKRATYSASYAISNKFMLAASLPLVSKDVRRFDLSHETANGIGDLDLSARLFMNEKSGIGTKLLWGLQFGLRLPTSSEQTSNLQTIDFDAQPGAGATLLSLGVWQGRYHLPWFFYGSAAIQHGISDGYQGYRPGDVLLATLHTQYALKNEFALQFSFDGRWKKHDHYFGVIDEDSGGLLIMATPGVAWTPITDLLINFSYQIPAIKNLNGRQIEEAIPRFGVTYDF